MTAPTVKVKPLVWPTEPRHNGIYRTKHNGTGIYYIMRVHAPNCVSWRCSEVFGWNDAGSEAAAKAAAQADYEASILSALDTTDLEAHIGAVLAEAAEAAWQADSLELATHGESKIAERILALRPDAMQALERVRREARVEVVAALQELTEVAERAIRLSQEHSDFKLYGMEPMWPAISAARALIEAERGKP